uniref:Radical SAM protein n=2 Tax=Staphylothermus marinus TaxID=2280 RepID=A0A7C4D7D9_STAMA
MFRKIIILDGYTDEPSGLGVPPYINTYPRLIAGVFRLFDKTIDIRYWTIDDARSALSRFIDDSKSSDLVVIIAGCEVPGKYVGGKPITLREIEYFAYVLRDISKVLVGPIARFGYSYGGGSIAVSLKKLRGFFTEIVSGDPELYFYSLLTSGWEKAEPNRLRDNYDLADKAFRNGAFIVTQHPNYGWNLIVEIETFRGCPRYIRGGCSFCIEPRFGKPIVRSQRGIIEEIEVLYRLGIRHIRLGKQPDILVYGSREIGYEEFPKPNPVELEKLFFGIRNVAPGLRTIHIDNVNPGTIARNPEESVKAIKIIIKYHTPGDVAALGIESFDEKVVEANNLKVYPDEALDAIRLINRYGSIRGWNGLPHLLPGINLLHGLPGESRETYIVNYRYLKQILDENLLIRRLNIRRISVLENTPLWSKKNIVESNIRRFSKLFESYRVFVMKVFDKTMLKRIVPPGTLMRYLYVEKHIGEYSIARQPASYPISVKIRGRIELKKQIDIRVESVAAKSVLGVIV